jgi:RNA polymerase sigma-70 factor (ECF subfamily)
MANSMENSAEADLLRRAQAGDQEASDALYREFFENNRQVHNLLLREVPAPEDREDILHDAFLSLIRSKSVFRGDSRLQTFVYRVVQIAILQKLRSDRARRHSKMVRLFVDLSGETVERELAVTDYGFERVDSEQMADRMYAVLPEPLRTALRLRVADDLSYSEVARRMGSPVNTAATRIFKARAILYKLFAGTQTDSQLPAEENLVKSAKKTEDPGN